MNRATIAQVVGLVLWVVNSPQAVLTAEAMKVSAPAMDTAGQQTENFGTDLHIPFTITTTGHLLVKLNCGDRELRMILDTGSGANVLTHKVANAITTVTQKAGKKKATAAGLGTQTQKVTMLTPVTVSYAKRSFVLDNLEATDLSNVQAAGGKQGIDGLLGSPFFRKYRVKIDYSKNELSFSVPLHP